MILKVTERCWTEESEETNEFYYREYEYITAADNVAQTLKNFLYEFDTDNVFNNNDLFDGECISSEIAKIEVVQQ